jgi:hypothetical protein
MVQEDQRTACLSDHDTCNFPLRFFYLLNIYWSLTKIVSCLREVRYLHCDYIRNKRLCLKHMTVKYNDTHCVIQQWRLYFVSYAMFTVVSGCYLLVVKWHAVSHFFNSSIRFFRLPQLCSINWRSTHQRTRHHLIDALRTVACSVGRKSVGICYIEVAWLQL